MARWQPPQNHVISFVNGKASRNTPLIFFRIGILDVLATIGCAGTVLNYFPAGEASMQANQQLGASFKMSELPE